jgi:hypothetical protein
MFGDAKLNFRRVVCMKVGDGLTGLSVEANFCSRGARLFWFSNFGFIYLPYCSGYATMPTVPGPRFAATEIERSVMIKSLRLNDFRTFSIKNVADA